MKLKFWLLIIPYLLFSIYVLLYTINIILGISLNMKYGVTSSADLNNFYFYSKVIFVFIITSIIFSLVLFFTSKQVSQTKENLKLEEEIISKQPTVKKVQ